MYISGGMVIYQAMAAPHRGRTVGGSNSIGSETLEQWLIRGEDLTQLGGILKASTNCYATAERMEMMMVSAAEIPKIHTSHQNRRFRVPSSAHSENLLRDFFIVRFFLSPQLESRVDSYIRHKDRVAQRKDERQHKAKCHE